MPNRHDWLKVPGLSWHDYNKTARAGRKVGHATLVADDAECWRERLQQLQALLDADTLAALKRLL